MPISGTTEVRCGACSAALPFPPDQPTDSRSPCPSCESRTRSFSVAVFDSAPVHEYLAVKHKPAAADRTLPAKGVTRSYAGVRRGRDGRLVERTATYDPYHDLAEERVVDVETGTVIAQKRESLKAKYQREGRWTPPRR